MRWPLRNQIIVPMALVMLGTLAGASVLNAWLSARRVRAQIERQLRDVTQTLAEPNFPLTDAVLRKMQGLSGAEFVLIDDAGAILASSKSMDAFSQLPRLEPTDQWSQLTLGDAIRIDDGRFFHTVQGVNSWCLSKSFPRRKNALDRIIGIGEYESDDAPTAL